MSSVSQSRDKTSIGALEYVNTIPRPYSGDTSQLPIADSARKHGMLTTWRLPMLFSGLVEDGMAPRR